MGASGNIPRQDYIGDTFGLSDNADIAGLSDVASGVSDDKAKSENAVNRSGVASTRQSDFY